MAYSTQQDLIDRFGQEELDRYAADDMGFVYAEKVAAIIQDADEVIDLYLASVVRLPIDPIPAIIKKLSSDIARYFLQDDNPLDEAKSRYDESIRLLKDIAAGRASLGQDVAATLSVSVDRGESDRVFTRDTLTGF